MKTSLQESDLAMYKFIQHINSDTDSARETGISFRKQLKQGFKGTYSDKAGDPYKLFKAMSESFEKSFQVTYRNDPSMIKKIFELNLATLMKDKPKYGEASNMTQIGTEWAGMGPNNPLVYKDAWIQTTKQLGISPNSNKWEIDAYGLYDDTTIKEQSLLRKSYTRKQ